MASGYNRRCFIRTAGASTGARTIELTGNTIESWLYALHMARVFGRAYQVFVCLTAVYIWWRKRKVRQLIAGSQYVLRPDSPTLGAAICE